ncbi:hypothetical protein Sme01_68910 [Sphaerisporangium melleum]|uniref:Mycothiol-dependent maleylpyruvate isomerase metal-binding domain-containing protein n=1 Tax=Sphaerisporangium melleum TaxID=321316 RepID=A0A917RLF1_9ACTN|nr:maleylpyruvate isomerase family mycothiol-dependent enzyme [Sphaerisporangium melleum]GGL12289.1 hypothetical protein GCM10007964_62940 [Sphaerisporangium melleum]GII74415.1 hypothetical protein Sme01_68910 [Sphaerisporangium melleum]
MSLAPGFVAAVRLVAGEAGTLAMEEHLRFRDLVSKLGTSDWTRPTDCPAWNVHDMLAHVCGAAEANASPLEMARQLRRARRGTRIDVDALSALQIADRVSLTPAQLIERLRRAERRAVRLRMALASAAGFVPLPVGEPVNENWPMRYLLRTIYTRDLWMHRIDVSRACDRPLQVTAGHDGRIVADLVADWAGRHGRPFALELTGPAGGRYGVGRPAWEPLEMDAIEFGRTLAGRGDAAARATGEAAALLRVPVPF